jgi:MYXO-CTERM domain-containing protein
MLSPARFARRLAVACALAVLNLAAVARAEAVLTEGSTSALGSGASVTFNHTVTGTPDQFLLVGVGVRSSGVSVSAVTFGGAPLALLVSASAGGYCRSELWGLVAPAPGTASILVTLSAGNSDSIAAAVSYAGVDGRSAVATSAATHGTRGSVSLSLTSASNEVVVDSVCGGANSAPTSSPGPGQTQRWNRTSGSLMLAGSDRPGAASVAMTWTLSVPAALGWSIAAVALRPAPAPSGPDAATALPDAGLPAAPDQPDAPSAPAGTIDSATIPGDGSPPAGDAPRVGTGDALARNGDGEAPDGDQPRSVTTELHVGCACRAAGPAGSEPGGLWLVLVAAGAVGRVRGRRRRSSSAG